MSHSVFPFIPRASAPFLREGAALPTLAAFLAALLLTACGGPSTTTDIDLSIHDAKLASQTVAPGASISVEFKVTNLGSQASPGFDVTVAVVGSDGVNTALQTATLLAVPAGDEVPSILSSQIPTTLAPGPYTIRVRLDPQAKVPQTNRSNDIAELSLTVAAPATGCADPQELVSFADPVIEAYVLARVESIGDGTMSCSNVAQIQQLNLRNEEVTSLDGVEHLTGVFRLDLAENAITDLGPMEGMTALVDITLKNNAITDLTPLAGLPLVEYLVLDHNQIVDLAPLSGMTTLEVLSVDGNQVVSLEPLKGLTNLTYLSAGGNLIASAEPVAEMTSLEDLELSFNAFAGLPSLAALDKLEYLRLGGPGFSDISGLAGLTAIDELNVYRSDLEDISALEGLTSLTTLYLAANQIVDISPLSGLTTLVDLTLDENRIFNISAVATMTGLDDFSAAGNKITDIAPLAANLGINAGDWVDIRGNCFTADARGTLIQPQAEHMRKLQVDRDVDVSYTPAGSNDWCGR